MASELLDEARRHSDAGRPMVARGFAARALDLSRSIADGAAIARAARTMGACLFTIGELRAARPLAEEAWRLDEPAGDAEDTAADATLLGVLDASAGHFDKARPRLQRAHDLRMAALGPDHPDTIESLNNLGWLAWRDERPGEALRDHENALERCERALGENHRRTAETLNYLAAKLLASEDTAVRGLRLSERAVKAGEAALGPDNHVVGQLLSTLAAGCINAGALDRGRALLDRALDLHERHLGPASPWTAYVLDIKGDLAWSEGRRSEARRAYERVFVNRIAELGPEHPDTLDAVSALQGTLAIFATGDARAQDEAAALYMSLHALRGWKPDPAALGTLPSPDEAAEHLRRHAETVARRIASDRLRPGSLRARIRDWWNRVPPRS